MGTNLLVHESLAVNLKIKENSILYYSFLLLNTFPFCETYNYILQHACSTTCNFSILGRDLIPSTQSNLFPKLIRLRMDQLHSCWPRTVWCVVNMFHKNKMRPLIIANRTKGYSILYCKSPWLYIRLQNTTKYAYWVISVKLDWLPGNCKKWTID